jgi:hypothetical protein
MRVGYPGQAYPPPHGQQPVYVQQQHQQGSSQNQGLLTGWYVLPDLHSFSPEHLAWLRFVSVVCWTLAVIEIVATKL